MSAMISGFWFKGAGDAEMNNLKDLNYNEHLLSLPEEDIRKKIKTLEDLKELIPELDHSGINVRNDFGFECPPIKIEYFRLEKWIEFFKRVVPGPGMKRLADIDDYRGYAIVNWGRRYSRESNVINIYLIDDEFAEQNRDGIGSWCEAPRNVQDMFDRIDRGVHPFLESGKESKVKEYAPTVRGGWSSMD